MSIFVLAQVTDEVTLPEIVFHNRVSITPDPVTDVSCDVMSAERYVYDCSEDDRIDPVIIPGRPDMIPF